MKCKHCGEKLKHPNDSKWYLEHVAQDMEDFFIEEYYKEWKRIFETWGIKINIPDKLS